MGVNVLESAVHTTPAIEPKELWDGFERQRDFNVVRLSMPSKNFYRFSKRCFDVIGSLSLGILLFIPTLVIGLLIRWDSPGPIFFKQERLGRNGIPFILYKFRSMHINAEANGPQWASKNDSRCTRLGKFLRNTRLDELPQLWNIFTGKMSFVGPRPERKCFYEMFDRFIPEFKERLKVKPGLTGLAQVNGGYDLRPDEKIVYDLEYIERRSVRMDLSCIFKTVKIIFTHEGAR